MASFNPRGGPRSRGSIGRTLGGLASGGLAFVLAALMTPGATAVPTAAPPVAGAGDGIWIAVYNGLEVSAAIHDLSGLLGPGDGIAVVMSANASAWGQDNQFATELHQAFPGVTLRAYLSLDGGTGRAGGLASTVGTLSPLFTQVSADWEVHGPVEFNPSYSATMAYFQEFAQIVQPTGRAAIGYPSGRGVFGSYAGAPDRWNYGKFATELNGMTIETQGYCSSLASWAPAVQKIWSQYNASGVPTSNLSLQISLGSGGNGVSVVQAVQCATYWRQVDRGNVFLWWEMGQLTGLETVLRTLEQSSSSEASLSPAFLAPRDAVLRAPATGQSMRPVLD